MKTKKIDGEWYDEEYASFREFINEQPAEVMREAFLSFFDLVYGQGEGTEIDHNFLACVPRDSFVENPHFSEDIIEMVENISRSFPKKS